MDHILKKKWERLWYDSAGSVYQSVAWIEALEKSGKKVRFITLNDGEEITAGFSLFESEVSLFGIRKKILTGYGSPLFLNASLAKSLLKEIKKEKGVLYSTIYPSPTETKLEYFEKAGFTKFGNGTIIFDLTKSETELFQKLEKKSVRWGVKTAEKNGLLFSEIREDNELNIFYKMYKSTAKEGGFVPESKIFIESLIKGDKAKLFLVKKSGKILAGGMVLIDKNKKVSILSLTSATKEGLKSQAMPFLYWKIIVYSKNIDLSYFDFGGYDREAKDSEKTYSINKFKERFNGDMMEQPIYSSNLIYPIIRNIMRKFRFLKKLYKKN